MQVVQMKVVARVRQFLTEVRVELAKVSWPTRPQLLESTRLVLVMTFLLGSFLYVWDLLASRLIQWLLR